MKVTVEIELDEHWEEYFYCPSEVADVVYLNDIKPELFLEDLFSGWGKDEIESVKLINASK